MRAPAIDLDKLRGVLRRMGRGELLIIAERAIQFLSTTKLTAVVRDRIRLTDIVATAPTPASLLEQVQKLHDAALRREYWEPFDVNWKNSTQKSIGTDAFIAEFHRLLDFCVRASRRRPRGATRQAFELLLELLRLLDEGREIVFFADEGGSFEVVWHWRVALPAYFRCLADDASAPDFAREVDRAISDFDESERSFHLAAAHRAARGEHRTALRALPTRADTDPAVRR